MLKNDHGERRTLEKICAKHGLTKFRSNGIGKYRCAQCQTIAVSKRRRKLKLLAVEYKGGKCKRCGYDKSPAALDFHHIDSTTKLFGISSKGLTRSFEKLKIELDKCIILCANCHREEHEEFNW